MYIVTDVFSRVGLVFFFFFFFVDGFDDTLYVLNTSIFIEI